MILLITQTRTTAELPVGSLLFLEWIKYFGTNDEASKQALALTHRRNSKERRNLLSVTLRVSARTRQDLDLVVGPVHCDVGFTLTVQAQASSARVTSIHKNVWCYV